MQVNFKPIFALCLTALLTAPVFAADTSVEAQLAALQKQVNALQSQVKTNKKAESSKKTAQVRLHGIPETPHASRSETPATQSTTSPTSDTNQPGHLSRKQIAAFVSQEREFLPFDLDVPGQAFVSTGPYVGVPLQFAGNNLVVNSPSVNTDAQLLSIRKSIHQQLLAMGGEIFQEPYHSHLLLSGVVEGQANYTNHGGSPSTTDIDVTNVSLDAFFIGPSEWTLGFIEFSYDGNSPANSVYTSDNNYRVSNSRVYINKAFITLGNFEKTPFYATIGQVYVPFGVYSSVMVSDTLTKLLGRTKARAIELGFMQQKTNAFYGSAFIFRGDSHANSVAKVNNGGLNAGYKFDHGFFVGNIGAGVIANLADSAGLQLTGFSENEQLVHRVPGYDLRGVLSFGEHVDWINEYVIASTTFNPNDMSYNNSGAKPWAFDTQLSYSFMIFDNKPSNIGIGYAASGEALAMGLPLRRYNIAFNTSVWRNTLQSIEFCHDREYAASNTGTIAGTSPILNQTGKSDNSVTAQFDYYF